MTITEELLEKYLGQRCSPEEESCVLGYLRDSVDLTLYHRVLDRQWSESSAQKRLLEADSVASLRTFKAKLGQKESGAIPVETGQSTNGVRGLSSSLFRVAAAITLLIAASLTVNWFTVPTKRFPLSANFPVQYEEMTNSKGQRSRVTLEDGSQIWLGAGSRIKLAAQFERGRREIWLEGEAAFKVAEEHRRPFVVHAGSLTTTVPGTSFYVQAYGDEPQVRVVRAVRSFETDGPSARGASRFLSHQRLTYDTRSRRVRRDSANLEEFLALQRGVLYLKDLDFGAIARKLERWYNVRITFEHDSMKGCEFSASFKNRSLREVLDRLRMTGGCDFTYEVIGKAVRIKQK